LRGQEEGDVSFAVRFSCVFNEAANLIDPNQDESTIYTHTVSLFLFFLWEEDYDCLDIFATRKRVTKRSQKVVFFFYLFSMAATGSTPRQQHAGARLVPVAVPGLLLGLYWAFAYIRHELADPNIPRHGRMASIDPWQVF
jgi:hypothetical protein